MQINSLYNPKLTPATLTMHLDPSWIPERHLLYISTKVAAAVKRGGARLIVSLPPRHGKSRLLSIGSTTWTVENFDKYNVGLCTYAATLSTDFSQAVRDQITLNPDKLDVRIRQGSNRVDRFLTEGGGGVYAFGLGGSLTGRGFHVFFLDDYIKEIKEALSPTYREDCWTWFTTTMMTRLEPGASVIIVATRWHEDDLIGRLIKSSNDWEYIRIPAIAERDDPVGRQPGEPLFPARYPLEELQRTKRLLGSHYFAAIYQQDPRSDASKMARKEWLQHLAASQMPNPNTLKWGRFWDLASLKGEGDYTVGALCGGDKNAQRLYVKHIVRDQLSPQGVEDLVKKTAEEDGKQVPIYIEEEPGSSGKHTIHLFKTHVLKGYNVIAVPSLKNKAVRYAGMVAGAERGDLVLQYGEWNDEFADEFDAIPTGAYDDQQDVVSMGWNELIGVISHGATWGRDKPTADGVTITDSLKGPVTGATWGRRTSGLLTPRKYINGTGSGSRGGRVRIH